MMIRSLMWLLAYRPLHFVIALLQAQNVDQKYSLLLLFALSLFFIFLFLALWDLNLRRWNETNPTLSDQAKNMFTEYDSKMKLRQRLSGLSFSFFLFWMVRQPELDVWKMLMRQEQNKLMPRSEEHTSEL